MEGNLMNLVCLVASGPATSGYAHSIDPHFYFTSTQAHDQPALQKVAKAMQRGPDSARRALESACDRGSISEFHELNFLFVAEATEANAVLREVEALATRPASKMTESDLRARFDEHCSAAERAPDRDTVGESAHRTRQARCRRGDRSCAGDDRPRGHAATAGDARRRPRPRQRAQSTRLPRTRGAASIANNISTAGELTQ
jgi:hypothetical protein